MIEYVGYVIGYIIGFVFGPVILVYRLISKKHRPKTIGMIKDIWSQTWWNPRKVRT